MGLATSIAAVLIVLVSLVAMADWSIQRARAWFVPTEPHPTGEIAYLEPTGSVDLLDAGGAVVTDTSGPDGGSPVEDESHATLQSLLGLVLRYPAWALGIPWDEAKRVGELIGKEMVVTEFLAYEELGRLRAGFAEERTLLLAVFALCGFASIPSIAVQLGALTALAPGRRRVFLSLGYRAMIGGAMASWLTASVMGLFI